MKRAFFILSMILIVLVTGSCATTSRVTYDENEQPVVGNGNLEFVVNKASTYTTALMGGKFENIVRLDGYVRNISNSEQTFEYWNIELITENGSSTFILEDKTVSAVSLKPDRRMDAVLLYDWNSSESIKKDSIVQLDWGNGPVEVKIR